MSSIFDAHMRLLSVLPVRTVQGRDVQDQVKEPQNKKKPIRVGSIEYPSVRDAARIRKCSPNTIYHLLDQGKAEYL